MRLFEYIEQGGPVMYLLVLLNIVGFALLLWKVFTVVDAKKKFEQTVEDMKARLKSLISLEDSNIGVNIKGRSSDDSSSYGVRS